MYKRIPRTFKENISKNLSYILFIAIAVAVIVGFNRSMNSTADSIRKFYDTTSVEDGYFVAAQVIKEADIQQMESRGYQIIKTRYIDMGIKDVVQLRIAENSEKINKLGVFEGSYNKDSKGIVLDEHFAKYHGYKIGDGIQIGSSRLTIEGIGITPNYISAKKLNSNIMSNPAAFGISFINSSVMDEVIKAEKKNPVIQYNFRFDGASDYREIKRLITERYTLLEWLERKDNSRIEGVFSDLEGPIALSFIMGILLLISIAFIIGVSQTYTIKSEGKEIGVLFSLGFTPGEVLRHYLALPFILTILGVVGGFWGGLFLSEPLVLLQADQYNFPAISFHTSWYLLVFGVVAPIVLVTTIVSYLIYKAVSMEPLLLLKGGAQEKHYKRGNKLKLKKISFVTRFRIRGVLKERGSVLTLMLGVLLCGTLMFTSFGIRDSVVSYAYASEKDLKYSSIYTLYGMPEKVPENAETAIIREMFMLKDNKTINFSLYGVSDNSNFFSFEELREIREKKDSIVISDSLSKKYKIKKGDNIKFLDKINDKEYNLIVSGVVPYSVGQSAFMSIEQFRDLLSKTEGYYNVLMSGQNIQIDSKFLLMKQTREEITTSLEALIQMLNVMSVILIAVSILVFIIMMYMILKIIIDHSSNHISLIKIFGFNDSEIASLYLNGNIIFVIIGGLLALPSGKAITSFFFVMVMESLEGYINNVIEVPSMVFSFALVIVSYWACNYLLMSVVRRVNLVEALKDSE